MNKNLRMMVVTGVVILSVAAVYMVAMRNKSLLPSSPFSKVKSSNPVNDGPDRPDCRRDCSCDSIGRCLCGTKCN